jgi:hypothetical protein
MVRLSKAITELRFSESADLMWIHYPERLFQVLSSMKVLSRTYPIEGLSTGQLAIVPRPRGGDWLEDEVQAWREGGFDVIVSLLTPGEQRELDIVDEADFARAKGLRFLEFPIPDYSVPTSFENTLAFLRTLDEALAKGEHVGIHCRQGIGRSSLIAAAVLVLQGTEPEEAFIRVRTARGRPVPDTAEQREWVTNFAIYVQPHLNKRS